MRFVRGVYLRQLLQRASVSPSFSAYFYFVELVSYLKRYARDERKDTIDGNTKWRPEEICKEKNEEEGADEAELLDLHREFVKAHLRANGQKYNEHLRAIKRRKWDEIENREYDVDLNDRAGKEKKRRAQLKSRESNQEPERERDEEIGRGAGAGDEGFAPLLIP